MVSALAGWPAAQSLTRYTGLNSQAAADIGHLFASPTATTSAVVGTAPMVFFVFSGIAAAAALQEIYKQVFDLPHRRIKDLPHRLAWLAVLIGASLLTGWAGPGLQHAGGPALLAVVGLVWATGFWWLTMRILLAGRISRQALSSAACTTGAVRGHADGLLADLAARRRAQLAAAHGTQILPRRTASTTPRTALA